MLGLLNESTMTDLLSFEVEKLHPDGAGKSPPLTMGVLGSYLRKRPGGVAYYGVLTLLVLLLVATGNTLFASIFLFFYLCMIYAWEKIFRLAWLNTVEERRSNVPCCGDKCTMTRQSLCRLVWGVYLFIAFTSTPLTQFPSFDLSGTEPNAYVTFSYNLLGSTLILLLAILVVEACDALRRFADAVYRRYRPTKSRPAMAENHKFKSLLSGVVYLILTISALATGYDQGRTVHIEVYITKLPQCLDGFTLGLLSDVHAGPLIGASEIARHVKALNREHVDAAILSGDMGDGDPEKVGGALAPIVNDLEAKFGIYFVTGNHEYIHGTGSAEQQGAAWMQWWTSKGVVVLNNNRTAIPSIPHGGPYNSQCNETFDLVGVPDIGHAPKLKAALAGSATSRAKILIAHQPLQITDAAKEKVDLQLSGHTHAGHLFPMHIGISVYNDGYLAGIGTLGSTQIYVSAGTVGWGPRTRLMSFNERTVITLRRGSKAASGDLYRPSVSIGVGLSAFVVFLQLFACVFVLCVPSCKSCVRSVKAEAQAAVALQPSQAAVSGGIGKEKGRSVRQRGTKEVV